MKSIVSGFFILLFFCWKTESTAQRITFKDIYELRNKDSLEFKVYCLSNGFLLMENKKDAYLTSYTYETPDKKYRILKAYPLDTSNSSTLYFYFHTNKEFKAYRQEIVDQLFLLRAKSSEGSYETYLSESEIYYNEFDQIQLESSYSRGASRGKSIIIGRLLEVDKKRWPYIKPSTKI